MSKVVKEEPIGCETCSRYGRRGYLVQKENFSVARICECTSRCPKCNGMGFVRLQNETGYSYINTCPVCGEVRRNVKLYNLAGIPAKYSDMLELGTFHPENESQQNALTYVKDFVKQYPRRRGFLLMGGPGRGKTHLAIGTTSELTLERGVKCIFKDFFHLLSELKEAYSQSTSENEVLLPLIETEILVIDELGKGESNKWELNILDQLISKRYNASKTTLITTNYVSREHAAKKDLTKKDYVKEEQQAPQILEDKVGERIASRLYEMCEFIRLEGEDQRRRAKVKKKA
jgi:DNA replication protein DnaC